MVLVFGFVGAGVFEFAESRVANRPVFPGTSRISAYMSRVPAKVAPGRIMSRFSAGLYSHSKSHAEVPRNNSFVFIFHSYTCKHT